jgi:hypothetical protein
VGNDVVLAAIVVELAGVPGLGAPVENRQPAPGALNAVILTIGGGRFVDGPVGWVVGVVGGAVPTLVVVADDELVVVIEVVVTAAGEWCSPFSWKPMTMSTDTHTPSPTRKGQLGPAPGRVDSLGI